MRLKLSFVKFLLALHYIILVLVIQAQNYTHGIEFIP